VEPDGALWAGTAGDGLFHVRAGGRGTKRLRAADGLDGDTVHALHLDRGGRLWVGQTRELLWIEDERIAGRYRHPAGAYVTTFLEDGAGGDLWIGTGIGLLRHRGGRFTLYRGAQGLHAEAVLGLTEDRHGYFWFCSRKGMFRVRKQDFDDLDAGRLARVASLRYGAIEGLTAVACSDGYAPRVAHGPDGRLWFSTLSGLVSVDPDRPAPPAPPVLVERLEADGAAAALDGSAALAPGTRRVQFLYTAPTFLAPDSVVFRYLLEGFDGGWVLAGGARRAEYTNLPPGRYRCRVAASTGDGIWREASAPLALRMRPHVWQTWPFLAACLLGAVGLAAAAFRARVRRIEDRFHAVLEERNRLSRELHDTLSARLGGMKLQLEAAARHIDRDPASARRALEEATVELPRSLAETRRAIWMLRERSGREDDLPAALRECARQMTAGTDARAEVAVTGTPRPLRPETTEHLVRIAQEALSNALRHGQARAVDLTLAFDARDLTMTITDDGRGLAAPPPAPAPDEAPAPAGHYGLAVMRERARLIGGRLDVGPGTPGGVRVAVHVPAPGLRALWRRVREALGAPS
jgi:signal transduction histidine kinase